MENIANYLKAVRALGMKEFEMFGTGDLYDEKNTDMVRAALLISECNCGRRIKFCLRFG